MLFRSLVCYLYTKANYLNRKCCSVNKTTHWKARGSQQTLRRIARHLAAMRTRYHERIPLVLALQDYLHCLETSTADAAEETKISRPNRRAAIERWKAEGELQILPAICASSPISCIVMLLQTSFMHYHRMGSHWSLYTRHETDNR